MEYGFDSFIKFKTVSDAYETADTSRKTGELLIFPEDNISVELGNTIHNTINSNYVNSNHVVTNLLECNDFTNNGQSALQDVTANNVTLSGNLNVGVQATVNTLQAVTTNCDTTVIEDLTVNQPSLFNEAPKMMKGLRVYDDTVTDTIKNSGLINTSTLTVDDNIVSSGAAQFK